MFTSTSGSLSPSLPPVARASANAVLDDWMRLERFLLLGRDASTYVAGRVVPAPSADVRLVGRCIAADGPRTVTRIAQCESGNGAAILALAIAAKLGDEVMRREAYAALPTICGSASDLLQFAAHARAYGGWGRGMRKAIGGWFNQLPADDLAHELARQPTCDRWTSRDLLRLSHPRPATPAHHQLFGWAVNGTLPDGDADPACERVAAIVRLQRIAAGNGTAISTAAELVRDAQVPLDCVPPPLLRFPSIWEALLPRLQLAELLSHLVTMTLAGALAAGSTAERFVVAQLSDPRRIAKARLHPIAVLAALVTYRTGRACRRGCDRVRWMPLASVIDALDAAFYASYGAVEPAGKRMLLALDVSGSMASGSVAGAIGLTPRLASAAMALVTAATERDPMLVAFTAGGVGASSITTMTISPRERLENAVGEVARGTLGDVDCALPMQWAQENRVDVDTFVVYTDHETWPGGVHPASALRAYREARSIPAKLVVVGMTSNGFAIADPDDAGMLDVVGFDASTPPVIADFARA